MTEEGERTLKMGKLKSGRHARRGASRPKASLGRRQLRLEQRTVHPFLRRNLGGRLSGATDFAKKPPLWWRYILTCWYTSLRFRGFGFLSLKKPLKQHVIMSPSLEHVHAFLQDSHINKQACFLLFSVVSKIDATKSIL